MSHEAAIEDLLKRAAEGYLEIAGEDHLEGDDDNLTPVTIVLAIEFQHLDGSHSVATMNHGSTMAAIGLTYQAGVDFTNPQFDPDP